MMSPHDAPEDSLQSQPLIIIPHQPGWPIVGGASQYHLYCVE
jgi:hypothetical protein